MDKKNDKNNKEQDKIQKIREEYNAVLTEALVRERREFPRVREKIPIILMGEKTEARLFSLDISLGGVRLLWNKPLKIGEKYDLAMALDEVGTWINVKGEVIWQNPHEKDHEIGMKFVEIDENQANLLQNHLDGIAQSLKVNVTRPSVPPEKEKRRHPRVARLLLAVIRTEEMVGQPSSALIVDISLGGARLVTSREFPVNSSVTVAIEVEDKKVIHLKGRIVWSNHVEALKKFQHGIEFVHAIEFKEYSQQIKETLELIIGYQSSLKEVNLVETLLAIMHEQRRLEQQ